MLYSVIPVSSPHTTHWCKKRYFTFSALVILKPPQSKETQRSVPQFHDSTFTHFKRNEEVILDIIATVAKCGRKSTMLLLLIFYQKKHKLWKKNQKNPP